MNTVYIGLGSNLSDPVKQLDEALLSIDGLSNTRLTKTSSYYGSKPQGPQDQPDFVNAVCQIETELGPENLLTALQNIEQQQGRVKKRHWGERLIDLDVLLYEQQQIQSERLTVPHPQLQLRDFVLLPLAEISPGLVIPGLASVEELIDKLEQTFVIALD